MNLLDEILAFKRAELAERMARVPLAEVRAAAQDAPAVRGFRRALEESALPVSLIAEVKPASPVAGRFAETVDAADWGARYARAGASCLSVLTEEKYFQGSRENLERARAASGLPVLRKDFTTAEYHIWEARAMGADAVLLIVNGLPDAELRGFRELAEELGMDALVEVHDAAEGERALASGATLIGVNNRDLTSFETTIEIGKRVLPMLRRVGVTLVGESAISERQHVLDLGAAGARAVLIGTTFMSAADPEARVREVMGL